MGRSSAGHSGCSGHFNSCGILLSKGLYAVCRNPEYLHTPACSDAKLYPSCFSYHRVFAVNPKGIRASGKAIRPRSCKSEDLRKRKIV